MAYCLLADVQTEFKGITFTADTSVTDATVEEFIAQADAEIDARLGVRFQTPVTAEGALPILKQIAVGIIAGRVQRILEVKGDSEQANQRGRGGDIAKDARATLQDIVDQKMLLPGADPVTTHQGVKTFATSIECPHTFKKDCNQW